jgi:phospholipid/cholesterol/gamma-HCH transport system substrate-binding protein
VKRENEFVVGLVVVVAFISVVAGALWLSGAHLGRTEAIYTARFRTVGGLGVGNPVVLRGVRVGRVEAIRLASGNWVEADMRIYAGVALPQRPAVVATSVSLFGEWAASLVSFDQPPDDPNVRRALAEAQAVGGGRWPGATLPDIGQLTAQAGRIANDIATVSARVQTAFDSEAVTELRRSIKDFGMIADRLARAADEQANNIGTVGQNLSKGSTALARAATVLESTLGRVDTATNQGQLAMILNNASAASQDVRTASQDLRDLLDATHRSQESFVRVFVSADTILSRIANRSGTLGLLVADSALYRETTLTMIQLRQLLSDVQANPRKYFTFSVF